MGQQEVRQKQQIQQNYTIVKTIGAGEYWVRRKKKGDELQLRLLTFYLEDEMHEYIKVLERRKKINNQHLLSLIQHSRINEQNMCSATFKIRIIIDYPFRTLKEQISERGSSIPRGFFNEDEMWSILYSCCHPLHSLYINKFSHQSLNTDQIFIDTTGIIKISDSVLVSTTKNYLSLMNEGGPEARLRYISPELVNLVEDNNFYFYEKQKSDVFILAMIILQIGNLVPVNYYNVNTKKFNFDACIPALNQIHLRYSDKFCSILEQMLILDFKDRPRFQDIINTISQKTIYTGSLGNTTTFTHFQTDPNNNPFFKQKPLKTFELPSKKDLKNPQLSSLKNQEDNLAKQHVRTTSYGPNIKFEKLNVESNIQLEKQGDMFINKTTSVTSIANFNELQINHLSRYVPKHQEREFKPSVQKVNTIVRDQPRSRENVALDTPYLHLLKMTDQKTENSNGSSQLIGKDKSNPVQKPNISRGSSGISPPLTHLPFVPAQFQLPDVPKIQSFPYQFRRFSESKLGNIELISGLSPNMKEAISGVSPNLKKEDHPNVKSIENAGVNRQQKGLETKTSPVFTTEQFVIEQCSQGKYEGFKTNGKRSGIGRLVYPDGGYYQGRWSEDTKEGYGKLYYKNDNIEYEGNWKNNLFEGQGKIYKEKPDFGIKGNAIDYKNLNAIEHLWISYQGEFASSKRNGKGIIRFVNGDQFNGYFIGDKAEGEGIFSRADGDIIKGLWRNGLYVGVG